MNPKFDKATLNLVDSTEASSENDEKTAVSSLLSAKFQNSTDLSQTQYPSINEIQYAVEASPEERSLLYLSSFECINFDWDTTCLSRHLQLFNSLN